MALSNNSFSCIVDGMPWLSWAVPVSCNIYIIVVIIIIIIIIIILGVNLTLYFQYLCNLTHSYYISKLHVDTTLCTLMCAHTHTHTTHTHTHYTHTLHAHTTRTHTHPCTHIHAHACTHQGNSYRLWEPPLHGVPPPPPNLVPLPIYFTSPSP